MFKLHQRLVSKQSNLTTKFTVYRVSQLIQTRFITAEAKKAVDDIIVQMESSQSAFSKLSQATIDDIFYHVALVANQHRVDLAVEAVNETKRGVVEDKILKNHLTAELVFNTYKDAKTCDIVEQHEHMAMVKMAAPVGMIAALTPVTNPTSTVMFKTMMALKTRNCILICPHPSAKNCTIHTAQLLREAAVRAGAPEHSIAWIEDPSVELTNYVMNHPRIHMIWATGGQDMVRAATSTGKAGIFAGAGNVPALIDETASIVSAVNSILLSKTFDNGMTCAAEQTVVIVDQVYDQTIEEFTRRGCYMLTRDEARKVAAIFISNGHVNKDIVGQSAFAIAQMAGVEVPENTRVLLGEALNGVGPQEPWSHEKLSPMLGVYRVNDWQEGVELCQQLINYGGRGHTASVFTDSNNNDRLQAFQAAIPVGTFVLNAPSLHGSVGNTYNQALPPTMSIPSSLRAGSRRVDVSSLLVYKTLAKSTSHMLWFRVPPHIVYNTNSTYTALKYLTGKERAFVVTDAALTEHGYVETIANMLRSMNITVHVFDQVEPDPSFDTCQNGLVEIRTFKPDVIVAFGGGSPIDAAKIMKLMYEHGDLDLEALRMRFMDITKRIYGVPRRFDRKVDLVVIPTTSGTGSEITPFAVVKDKQSGIKYPIADYIMTPQMAIIDPQFSKTMPKSLKAVTAYDALTHAVESYVSVLASDYTSPLSARAAQMLVRNCVAAYNGDEEAQAQVHHASSIAGLALANAFVGIGHSIAHQLGSAYDLPHGLCCALALPHVVRYNASEHPMRVTAFPNYRYPMAKERYAELAVLVGAAREGLSKDAQVDALVEKLVQIRSELNLASSLAESGVGEAEHHGNLHHLTLQAFDDQCTVSNPRFPLLSELSNLFEHIYTGQVNNKW